jgi:hypothetical protein
MRHPPSIVPDAFDQFWKWANKPVDKRLMLDGCIYNPVMALPEHHRRDRAKVNEAVARYVWPEKEVALGLMRSDQHGLDT